MANVALVPPSSGVGEDDEGATTTAAVTLQIVNGQGSDSGLDTSDGTQIDLFLEANGDVTGRIGGVNGTVIFAIRIDGSGNATVAQYDSLQHGDAPDNYDEARTLAGNLNAVITVTDGDDDVAIDTVAIGAAISFEDDGPSVEIAPAVADASPTTDTVAEDGADLTGAITLVEGADQDATLAVTLGGGAVLSQPLTFTLDGTAQSTSATVTLGGDELGVLTIAIAAGGTATWTFNPSLDFERRSVVQLHGDGDGCGRRR